MKIGYSYFGNWTKEQKKIMHNFGIYVELGADNIRIEKGDLHDNVLPYLQKWGYANGRHVGTLYSKKEIDNAELLIYVANWTNGYPQPELEWFSGNGITYNREKICSSCNNGLVQKEPFRLRKAPKWGKKNAFELEWIYGEIFVKKDIYELVFKPLGIDYWDVLLYKKETIIEDTVQLKLPISDVALSLENIPFEVCKECGIKRFFYQIDGYFPNFVDYKKPKFPICNSQEIYGSGWQTDRWIILTKELRQLMIKHGINPRCSPIKMTTNL